MEGSTVSGDKSSVGDEESDGYEEMEGIQQQHLVGSSPKYVSREEEDRLLQIGDAHGSPQLSKPTAEVRKNTPHGQKYHRNRPKSSCKRCKQSLEFVNCLVEQLPKKKKELCSAMIDAFKAKKGNLIQC
jgi:hypothetical protein